MECPQHGLWDKFVDPLGFIPENIQDKGFAQKKSFYFFKSTNAVPGELEELIAGDYLSSQPVYLVVNNSLTIVPF